MLHALWHELSTSSMRVPLPKVSLTFELLPRPSIGSTTPSSFLYVLVASKGSGHLRSTTSVYYTIPSIPASSRFTRPAIDEVVRMYGPNSKPVCSDQRPIDLSATLIRSYSSVGDCVLSLCAGTGTDGISALMLCRSVCLVEKRPDVFHSMFGRIQQFADVESGRKYHQTMLGAILAREEKLRCLVCLFVLLVCLVACLFFNFYVSFPFDISYDSCSL